jgi:radical SAM-linked protein
MIRLRSCFEIQGGIRFLSHLDILKLIERSLRRAAIPVEFSQGFNPHPKIAFGPARPVGLASLCEYFDVELKEPLDPEDFRIRLQEKFPADIKIRETVVVPLHAKALTAVLNCAIYEVELENSLACSKEELQGRVEKLLDRKEIVICRHSPKGKKEVDIRPGIWGIFLSIHPDSIIMKMEVMIGEGVNTKPGEVIQSMGFNSKDIIGITRTGLFIREADGRKSNQL